MDREERAWRVVARHITSNVRTLRAAKGWTQEALAERSGLDAKYIQEIEAGPVNVSVRVLVALARAFRVEPAKLLEPAPPPKRRRPGRPPSGSRASA